MNSNANICSSSANQNQTRASIAESSLERQYTVKKGTKVAAKSLKYFRLKLNNMHEE